MDDSSDKRTKSGEEQGRKETNAVMELTLGTCYTGELRRLPAGQTAAVVHHLDQFE